jgi:hypothetical protein
MSRDRGDKRDRSGLSDLAARLPLAIVDDLVAIFDHQQPSLLQSSFNPNDRFDKNLFDRFVSLLFPSNSSPLGVHLN